MTNYDRLTLAQRAVLALVMLGDTNSEIQQKLCISKSTVQAHLNNIYEVYDIEGQIRRTRLVIARYKELFSL